MVKYGAGCIRNVGIGKSMTMNIRVWTANQKVNAMVTRAFTYSNTVEYLLYTKPLKTVGGSSFGTEKYWTIWLAAGPAEIPGTNEKISSTDMNTFKGMVKLNAKLLEAQGKITNVEEPKVGQQAGAGESVIIYYNKDGKKYRHQYRNALGGNNKDITYGVWWYSDVVEEVTPEEAHKAGAEDEGKKSNKAEDDMDKKAQETANEYVYTPYSNNDIGENRQDTEYVGIFTPEGKELFNLSTPNGESNTTLINMTSTVLGIIQVVGSVLSVLILVILGIKYMAGSVEEKADYKKELPIYVLGAVILFSISNLLSVIYNWAIGLNNIS